MWARRRRRRLYTVSILYCYKKDNYNWSPIDTLLYNITSQLRLPLHHNMIKAELSKTSKPRTKNERMGLKSAWGPFIKYVSTF